jgi:WD repeat-containing protein 23
MISNLSAFLVHGCRFLLSITRLLLLQVTGAVVKKLSWHRSIIRDCTWHPYRPTLISSSWDGYVARWEASGDKEDPSMLSFDEQRTSPYHQTYGLSFAM